MADLTEHFTKEFDTDRNRNGAGATEARTIEAEDQAAEDKRVENKAFSAYDQTDLPVTGPSKDKYDYTADYTNGNNFKAEGENGIQLNNKHFKKGTVNIGGYDMYDGRKYQNKWEDKDGHIAKATEMLKKEDFNTVAGSSHRNNYGLFEAAQGVVKEGGSFEDYKGSISGPWSEDQMAMAYSSAFNTRTVMDDTNNMGKRYYDKMLGDYETFEGRIAQIPAEGFTEETLATNADWLKSGREFMSHFRGEIDLDDTGGNQLSDEKVDETMKYTMAMFRHNLPMMMHFANEAMTDESGRLARNLLVMDEMYDELDISGSSVRRMGAGFLMDPTNYITLGGGILVTSLGKFAGKESLKHALKRAAIGVSYDAVVGAGFGAAFENEFQNVEMAAGTREEKDIGKIGTMAAIEGGANVLIGGPLNIMTDKNLRGFAGKNLKKGYEFMKKNGGMDVMPPKFGGTGQKGMVDLSPFAADKVQLTSNLQQWIDTDLKEGMSVDTIRQNLKAQINKGTVKPQEVKWSGIEAMLDEAEAKGTGIDPFRLLKRVEAETPRPKLVNVAQTSYDSYTLLNDELATKDIGYRERMIVIPGERRKHATATDVAGAHERRTSNITGGRVKYQPAHFAAAAADQLNEADVMLAHSRVESAKLGDSKGKMILEIQSDLHKKGQQKGYISGGKLKSKEPAIGADTFKLEQAEATDYNSINSNILRIARDHNIDPYQKNSMALIYQFLNKQTKAKMDALYPAEQPFGSDWDAMAMRLEILDSINSGDEFIAFPANAEQIGVVEQWGAGYSNEGIVKRSTKNRIKALKKMGLEVEQIDMPEYKGLGASESTKNLTPEETEIMFEGILGQRGQLPITTPDGYKLYADPDGQLRGGALPEDLPDGGELLREFTHEEWQEFIAAEVSNSQKGLKDSTFNVIRLTKGVKDKFLKEGMPLYSVGGFAAGEEIKEKIKPQRDGKGRFIKQ